MNATASTKATFDAPAPDAIDTSCRAPLLLLFCSGALWLVIASIFGMMASIKFHAPDFLSNFAALTYGRVYAVGKNALLYGFAVQAGLGVGLWILTRLGSVRAAQPALIAAGGALWNTGVLVGVLAILAGNSTGFENLEMPRHAGVLLFLGFLIMALWMLVTVRLRQPRPLQPAQWFLIAALFWFPWILSTAYLLLVMWPVRGVTQAIVSWWFTSNLKLVWLGLVGLGAVFQLVPMLMKRLLHSDYSAYFTFWTLILFASWSGIPFSAPVPAWIPALSTVATVLTTVTVLSVITNIQRTCGYGCEQTKNPPEGKFIAFGTAAFVFAWSLNILASVPGIREFTQFTWFTTAQSELNVYGFFSMVMFGAIYLIVPRVTGAQWPWPKWVGLHFWLAAAGIVLIALPLAIGGVLQGWKLNHPPGSLVEIARGTLHFYRISTIGETLLLLGHLVFAINLFGLLQRMARQFLTPVVQSAMAEQPSATEVRQ